MTKPYKPSFWNAVAIVLATTALIGAALVGQYMASQGLPEWVDFAPTALVVVLIVGASIPMWLSSRALSTTRRDLLKVIELTAGEDAEAAFIGEFSAEQSLIGQSKRAVGTLKTAANTLSKVADELKAGASIITAQTHCVSNEHREQREGLQNSERAINNLVAGTGLSHSLNLETYNLAKELLNKVIDSTEAAWEGAVVTENIESLNAAVIDQLAEFEGLAQQLDNHLEVSLASAKVDGAEAALAQLTDEVRALARQLRAKHTRVENFLNQGASKTIGNLKQATNRSISHLHDAASSNAQLVTLLNEAITQSECNAVEAPAVAKTLEAMSVGQDVAKLQAAELTLAAQALEKRCEEFSEIFDEHTAQSQSRINRPAANIIRFPSTGAA